MTEIRRTDEDGFDVNAMIREVADDDEPMIVADPDGHEVVVMSPDAYRALAELEAKERQRLAAQREEVRARLQELDAGAPVRAFTTVEEMTAAADADRAVRRVA